MSAHRKPLAAGPIGACVTLLSLMCLVARPAHAQLQIATADGKQSFKIGFLGQFQGESIDSATTSATSKNLFIRRLRVLGSFKLSDRLSVFFETDAPNLGKGNPDGTKNAQDLFLQDAHVTYTHDDRFNVDAGMMMLAPSYNHQQSAATFLGMDYGPYTFTESTPLTARVGRDYGVRLRGLLSGHLEYRLAVVQGLRGPQAANALRFQGRVAYDAYGAQPGFFYRGTSLGKIKTLAVGANVDTQKGYTAYGADAFFDRPVASGDGVTLQVDFTHWDGQSFLTTIPKQNTLLVEAGYYIHAAKLLPYVQYAQQDFSSSTLADEKRPQFGIGYYFDGHNSNLKLAYTRIDKTGAKKLNQFQLQYQIYVF